MRTLLCVLALAALGALGALGADDAARRCPSGCKCDRGDGELEYECKALGFNMRAQPNDYAHITCTSGDLELSKIPLFPLSNNSTLNSVILRDCRLPRALAPVLARFGARAADMVTLHAPRGRLDAAWVKGAEEITMLTIVDSKEQQRVPWDVIDALPKLKDFRQRGCNLTLDDADAEDPEAPAHPALRTVELSLDGVRALPPGVRHRLRAVQRLYVWGNGIRNITADSFAGLDAVETLDLSRNPMEELGARALATPALRHLVLVGTRLRHLRDHAFAGLDQLESVLLKFCRQQVRLEGGALAARPALRSLTLERCAVSELPPELLHGSKALETLMVTYAGLETLPAGLFHDQARLRVLDLSNNQLRALSAQLLWPLRALQSLTLDDNHIEELPEGLFSGLTQLRNASCERNRLSRVAAGALDGAEELRLLSLADNRLAFGSKVIGGYEVLESTSPFAGLRQLRALTLRGNQLSRVFTDWLWVLLSLQNLDLSYNNYTEITAGDLQFLSAGITVDLRYNKIRSVELMDGGEGAPPPASATVLLDHNPFSCDCHLYRLVRRVRGETRPLHTEPRLELGDAKCAAPRELAGRRVRSLSPAALTCAARPADCPRACACAFRPASAALELDCAIAPATFPSPTAFGLNHTYLRLRALNASEFRLPAHVTVLNLTGVGLTESPPAERLAAVRELDLTWNNLTSVPLELLNGNATLLLRGNPFTCDCAHAESVRQLGHAARVADAARLTCAGGGALGAVDAGRLCDMRHAALLGGVLAALGALAALAAVLAYKFASEIKAFLFARDWCGVLLRDLDADKDARYDAFVSFAEPDARWVAEQLVPVLEDKYKYKLCLHYRDWVVGDMIPAQIARSVEQSRRTIVVLSRSFLQSKWAMLEFRAAYERAQREKRARVLVLALDDAPAARDLDPELRAYLATNTYLKWGDRGFWNKLRCAMPHGPAAAAPAPPGKPRGGALDARLAPDGSLYNAAALDADKPLVIERV